MIIFVGVLLLNQCLLSYAHVIPRFHKITSPREQADVDETEHSFQEQLYQSDDRDPSLLPSPVDQQTNKPSNKPFIRTDHTQHRNHISQQMAH